MTGCFSVSRIESVRLSSCLGQSLDSLGAEAHFHDLSALERDALGLKIDLECSFGGGVGVAAGITRLRSSSGHLAYTTHSVLLKLI